MSLGVASSATLLLMLSRGVLQRPFCQAELITALEAGKPLLLLHETDDARGGAPLEDLLREGDDAVASGAARAAGAGQPRRWSEAHMTALRSAAARAGALPFRRGRAFDEKTMPAVLNALNCAPGAAPPPAPAYRLRRRALPSPEGAHVVLLSGPEGYDQCAALARAMSRLCSRIVVRCLHEWEASPETVVSSSVGGVLLLTARVWEDSRTAATVAAFRSARRPLRLLHEADPRHGGAVAFGDVLEATPAALRAGPDGGLYGSAIADVLERRRDKRALMMDALMRSAVGGALREGDASVAGLRAAPPPLPWQFSRAPVAQLMEASAAALTSLDGPVALVLGGAGGAGKSAAAAALVREPAVRAVFDDVLWITLGVAAVSPAAFLAKLADALAAAIDGDDGTDAAAPSLGAALADVPSAAAALAALLARRPLLLVADDAPPDSSVLCALMDAVPKPPTPGASCPGWSRLLVTTRDLGVFERAALRAGLDAGGRGGFVKIPLLPLSAEAAALHLAEVAGLMDLTEAATPVATAPLARLAALTGGTPLSLGLVGGALRTQVERPGLGAASAAAAAHAEVDALEVALAAAPLPAQLANSASATTFRAVDAALRASFAPADVDKYVLLGALPHKATAPFSLFAAAWRMPQPRCVALLRALQAAALLKYDTPLVAAGQADVGCGVVTLHDLHAEYAAAMLAARDVAAAAHAHLLARARVAAGMEDDATAWDHRVRCGGGDSDALAAYVWDYAPLHLARSGRPGDAVALLTRLGYLQGLLARRGVAALLAQLSAPWATCNEECRLLAAALRLSPVLRGAGVDCAAGPAAALPAQLVGRLGGFGATEFPRLALLVAAARAARGPTHTLLPRGATLSPPGVAEQALLTGHSSAIVALTYLPNGLLLSASADATLRLWSLHDTACVAVMEGSTAPVEAVACWAWQERADAAAGAGAVPLANAAAPAEEAVDRPGTLLVRIASVASDGQLRVWSGVDGTADGLPLRLHPGPFAATPTALAACVPAQWPPAEVAACGDVVLFVGDSEGSVAACVMRRPVGAHAWTARWSVPVKLERPYPTEPPGVLCAVTAGVHPHLAQQQQLQRALVVTGHRADAVAVWAVDLSVGDADAASPPVVMLLRRLLGHTGWITDAALTPAGTLLTCSWDRTLRLWGRPAMLPLSEASSDATANASAARVFANAAPEWRRMRGATAVAAMSDGATALVGYQSGALAVWPLSQLDAGAGSEPGAPPARQLQAGAAAVTALAALPDGRAASGGADGVLRLWGLLAREMPRPHTAEVTGALPLGSDTLISAGADGVLCIWDAHSGALRLRACRRGSYFACISLDGNEGSSGLFLGDWDGVCVRRLDLQQLLRDHEQSSSRSPGIIDIQAPLLQRIVPVMSCGRPTALAPLPRGRLAGGGWHNWVNVWNPAQLVECYAESEGNEEPPIGRAKADAVIVAELKGHSDYVTCLAALPWRACGDALVSGSRDATVRVWEAAKPGDEASWVCVAVLHGHEGHVNALVALPSVRRAASASEDGTVCVWNLGGDPVLLVRSLRMGSPLLSLVLAATSIAPAPLALWAGAADGTLHLLDARTARCLFRDPGIADAVAVRALATSPSGCLMAGTARGEVHAYQLLPPSDADEKQDEARSEV